MMKYTVILHPSLREEVERLVADDSATGEAAITRDMLRSVECLYQGEVGRLDGVRFARTPAHVPRVLSGAMPFTTAHVGAGRWAC
ncbi:MAG: hypothetical protein E6Q97_30240 [Desulfurellales bacterium]|nr:MAG: hypothetical protein E6Q97_30240 [Desulfurellales bacterium]